jgi:hypothetical protein
MCDIIELAKPPSVILRKYLISKIDIAPAYLLAAGQAPKAEGRFRSRANRVRIKKYPGGGREAGRGGQIGRCGEGFVQDLLGIGRHIWLIASDLSDFLSVSDPGHRSGPFSKSLSTSSRWMMSQASLSVGVTFMSSRRPLSSRLFSTAGVSSQITKEEPLS